MIRFKNIKAKPEFSKTPKPKDESKNKTTSKDSDDKKKKKSVLNEGKKSISVNKMFQSLKKQQATN
jgi:hypothetical protein